LEKVSNYEFFVEKVGKIQKSPLEKLKVAFYGLTLWIFQYVDEHIF
jgi:hypothetical protein